MIVLLVILVITFILIFGAGLAFLQMFNPKKAAAEVKPDEPTKPAEKTAAKTGVRWSYFILPVIILLISVVITFYFYGQLPDTVTLRPDSDSSANVSRLTAALWAIVPQLLMALIAMVITWGASKISNLFSQTSGTGVKQLESILMVMSNMVVIPQMILLIAMLNIFSYNSFQTHISFVWWVSLIIILAGIVFLSIFFMRALQKMGNQAKKQQ
jgi:heme/copper-type cytochrome/quinol oxidase subunit 2